MIKRKLFKSSASSSGFTILEVLVVLILVGIVAAFAAPGWLGYLSRQRVSRTRSDLAQVLQQAQIDARQQNASRIVKISSANPPQLEVSSTPGSAGRVIELGDQNASISIAGGPLVGATVASVAFDYKGTVTSGNLPFVFSVTSDNSSANSVRCVIVSTLLGNLVQAEGNECNDTSGLN